MTLVAVWLDEKARPLTCGKSVVNLMLLVGRGHHKLLSDQSRFIPKLWATDEYASRKSGCASEMLGERYWNARAWPDDRPKTLG